MHELKLNEHTETNCCDETQTSLNHPEASSHFHTPILSDNEINSKIRSLNIKQRQIFGFIHNWVKINVKVKSATTKKQLTPLHLFFSGRGGSGKTHLTQSIFQQSVRYFYMEVVNPS